MAVNGNQVILSRARRRPVGLARYWCLWTKLKINENKMKIEKGKREEEKGKERTLPTSIPCPPSTPLIASIRKIQKKLREA